MEIIKPESPKLTELSHDSINAWPLAFIYLEKSGEEVLFEAINKMESIMHYEDYLDKMGYYRTRSEDPELIISFDELVDEFNDDLERIKNEKDIAKILSFIQRASDIMYQTT